jgi:acyl-CoA dehydrogenase
MRAVGQAEVALELMIERSLERKTFGKYLHQHGVVSEWIAKSRIEIDQARLLILNAAWMMDSVGAQGAAKEIAMIKVVAPNVLTSVADRAIQTFGGMGVSPDTPLADSWCIGRWMRLADGPDEVHLRSIARQVIRQHQELRADDPVSLGYLTGIASRDRHRRAL